jgi:rhodanese-related sulfurtransferase
MVAANVVRGDLELADWNRLKETHALLLDVREPAEFADHRIEGAINIPLGQLRDRLDELPRDTEIWVSCGVGQRAYYACRLLSQHGFKARNLPGGYEIYRVLKPH